MSAALVRLLACACLALAGCAGPTLLKEPRASERPKPIAEASDERIHASIEDVIFTNGPGAWVSDAQWDQYVIRIRSLSAEPVEVREIAILDALDQRIESGSTVTALLDRSRAIARASGAGAVTVFTQVYPFLGLPAVTGGLVLLAITGMAAQEVSNAAIDREIGRRRTTLPALVPPGAQARMDLFFPLAPSSTRVQVVYSGLDGEHRLDIDTRAALLELNPPPTLVSRIDPDFPREARYRAIGEGRVTARLTLDKQGRVTEAVVLDSTPRDVFDAEAVRTFRLWRYDEGRYDGRIVTATLEFRR